MRTMIIVGVALLAISCGAPSIEEEIASIRSELAEFEIDKFCQVSVLVEDGRRVYLIDTPMALREDNFADCIVIYAAISGCVARAINEPSTGLLRVGTQSLWIDMEMEGVFLCHDASKQSGDVISVMQDHVVFLDRR